MINVIYNYYIYDYPYNQNTLKQGVAQIAKIAQQLEQDVYAVVGQERSELKDNGPDYIVVEHTCPLSQKEKAELADAIAKTATLKKEFCGDEKYDRIIVFNKKESEDIFVL